MSADMSADLDHEISDDNDEDVAPGEFDWSDMEILCQRQDRSCVYINPVDQIVIRQERDGYHDDDNFVFFDRTHLPALIAALSEYVTLDVALCTVTSNRDSTAASRKRRQRARDRDTKGVTP